LLLLPDSCTTPLPSKLYALTHPLNLLANWERLWTFDLDKSQMRGRYNCIKDIRKSHCQPFCLLVCLAGVSTCLHPPDQEKLPCQDFLSHMSVFSTRGLLIPTIWRLDPEFYIPSRKGVPALPRGDVSCCLVVVAQRFSWGWQLSRFVNELRLQNFLTTQVKKLQRQGPRWPSKFCAQTKTRNVTWVTK
jgi:hypothetical protein